MNTEDFEERLKLLGKLKEIKPPEIIRYAVIPLPDVLLVLFVAFKLAGIGEIAHWNWIWVVSPFWASILIPMLRALATKLKNFIDKVRSKMRENK